MKNLISTGSFLGYIVSAENKRIQVCLPFGEYKIKRSLKRYIELDLKVYQFVDGDTKEFYVRIKSSDISDEIDKPFFYPVHLYWGENLNQLNRISLVEFNAEDYICNSTEISNEAFAFFDGLERIEFDSEFESVGTIYSWEDAITGDIAYDGIEGITYKGEAPPYNCRMDWLINIHTKIDSLRSANGKKPCIVISGNTCGIVYRAIPGKVYSINDCKVFHSKSTLMESMYSAMANFVKKYPKMELYN